jgi:hypothetical protein
MSLRGFPRHSKILSFPLRLRLRRRHNALLPHIGNLKPRLLKHNLPPPLSVNKANNIFFPINKNSIPRAHCPSASYISAVFLQSSASMVQMNRSPSGSSHPAHLPAITSISAPGQPKKHSEQHRERRRRISPRARNAACPLPRKRPAGTWLRLRPDYGL